MQVRRSLVAVVMAAAVGGAGLVAGAAGAGAASTGTITTIAGTGVVGTTGNGGPATAATLEQPSGFVYDKAGNLYVSDYDGEVVRKISPQGTITAFAGTGTGSYSGDGGAATAATIHGPIGLAIDAAGNIYIADNLNNRVRVVSAATGNISTFAGTGTASFSGDGGAATAATLSGPIGLAFDGSGRLLITDSGNNRVRRVATDATISTIAGTGAAMFSGDGGAATAATLHSPTGVALDANQNILIADLTNTRIRRISASTGVIATIAGTNTSASTGDGGPASTASLRSPYGLAVDNAGDVFIGDLFGSVVRRIGANGIISTVAGTATAGFNGDGQAATSAELNGTAMLAISPSSDLVISDLANHRVRSVSGIASQGYLMAASDGGVFTHGSSIFYGSEGGLKLVKPIVTMASTPTKQGYWLFASDGGVFTHGDAGFFGSEGSLHLNQPIVAAAATPDGKGYWLFASDGGVFTHGDAGFFGSEGALKLNKPIVASASTPTGKGYWLFASDGGVFTHGDAKFYGSEGALKLVQPIVTGTAN